MLSFLLAAAVANAPIEGEAQVAPKHRAVATVRIVRPAQFRSGKMTAGDGESLLRSAQVRDVDGSSRTAALVEFL